MEKKDCAEYNFNFGIFVVVQIFLKPVRFLLPIVSSVDKTWSWPHGLGYCVGHGLPVILYVN